MSPVELSIAGIVVAAVVAVLMIVVALPVVLSMRHAARDREFQHAERLKALEVGLPWPGEPAAEVPPADGGTRIGVWVPLGAMAIALAATRGAGDSPSAVATWVAAGSVGVAGVSCGTILAVNTPARATPAERGGAPAKPAFWQDDVDTVSRRG